MNKDFESEPASDKPDEEAAIWMAKLDRNLSAAEQDAFFDWIAADPRNADALAEQRRNWKRLDTLGAWKPEHSDRANPNLIAPASPRRRLLLPFIGTLAAAACVALAFFLLNVTPDEEVEEGRSPVVAQRENRTYLEDGSYIKTKGGAGFSVRFSDVERRILLENGEAFFVVAKDSQRPFVVETPGVDVKAVGTAFNVKLELEYCEVLVAEGIVSMEFQERSDLSGSDDSMNAPSLLKESQLAIVPLDRVLTLETEVQVLSKDEMIERLDWQHGLLNFSDRGLFEIVEELNYLNDVQLRIADPELGNILFSGSVRSDNMEGFARLLETGFGAKADFSNDAEIVLTMPVQ